TLVTIWSNEILYMSSADVHSAPRSPVLTEVLMRRIFFFHDTPTPEIYTLSLHDALPISGSRWCSAFRCAPRSNAARAIRRSVSRSEEHTSELQSRRDLVCRLLLEKKKSCREPDPPLRSP